MRYLDAISSMDDFWSRIHGSPGKMHIAGVHIAVCDGADRVLLLKRGDTLMVSAPSEVVPLLRASEAGIEQLFDHTHWLSWPNVSVDRIIGPAYLGFLTSLHLAPMDNRRELRILTENDAQGIDELRRACEGDEWDHSALDEGNAFQIGAILKGRIVSAAGYQIVDDRLAFMGFITHPEHRRQGHGLAAASEVVRTALSRDLLPIWRTLLSNQPSIKVAQRLGFEEYAVTNSVRLANPNRSSRDHEK